MIRHHYGLISNAMCIHKATNAYLDIDGVLLTKKGGVPEQGVEFIEFLLQRYTCFWLTTHCRGGVSKALEYLSKYYPDQVIRELSLVKPVFWDTLKTEGIDFSTPFLWFEDQPFQSELAVLDSLGKRSSLIHIHLDRISELRRIMNLLSDSEYS